VALTPPKQIALLCLARSAEFPHPHQHYVACPVLPGAQACLVELPQPDGTVRLSDGLTVLPANAPHAPSGPDPIYAAYLGVIAAHYADQIAKANGDPRITALAATPWDKPPFLAAQQRALVESMRAMFKTLEYGEDGPKVAPGTMPAWERLAYDFTNARFWIPRHLECGKARDAWHDQWRILEAWDSWEERKLPWKKRLIEHYTRIGKTVGQISQEKDSFEGLCRYLGLRFGDMSPYKRLLTPFPTRTIIY
jgi:hypothetical protein